MLTLHLKIDVAKVIEPINYNGVEEEEKKQGQRQGQG